MQNRKTDAEKHVKKMCLIQPSRTNNGLLKVHSNTFSNICARQPEVGYNSCQNQHCLYQL